MHMYKFLHYFSSCVTVIFIFQYFTDTLSSAEKIITMLSISNVGIIVTIRIQAFCEFRDKPEVTTKCINTTLVIIYR